MNLLLLLSALLSAFGGAATVTRPASAPQALVLGIAESRVVATVARRLVERPLQQLASLITVASAQGTAVKDLPVSSSFYANRRRE